MGLFCMKKGKLIVIDGTDGSGKGTQTEKLVERLKSEGHSVFMLDFPQYGERSAAMVEDYLNGKFGTAEDVGPYRASIFYACDRYAISKEVRERLDRGEIIISNRYVSANMGHQAGKISSDAEKDEFLDWLKELEYSIFGIPEPDCQILLYADPVVAQKLVDGKGHRDYVGGEKRDIHEADINHLKNASEAFLYCAKKFDWSVVECTPGGEMRSIEDIHEDVYEIVRGELGSSVSGSWCPVDGGFEEYCVGEGCGDETREIIYSIAGMSDDEKAAKIRELEKRYGVKAEIK